ncbi:MAG: ribonuclease III [Anaerolineales bacterium]|nr:ribonuclease III [Anaerolineales bacterium]
MYSTDQGVLEFENPEDFAARLGLPFSRMALLRRALTHSSYVNENPDALEDNERLEFLGDAVLDFMVGAWLYNRFPEKREGELTRLRSSLVCTDQLAEFARQVDLGRAMRLGRGESQAGGRKRRALLCAGFEALIGALYLDQGMQAVMAFIEPLVAPVTDRGPGTRRDDDPKSLLQEIIQARGYGPPQYRTVSASGPEHQKTFEVEALIGGKVIARGEGHSKRSAAKAAARSALDLIDQRGLD